MPYVVTTKRCNCDPVDEDYPRADCPEPISRREVATLEEAREAIQGASPYGARALMATSDPLSESGGTLRLPDGTVIEVVADR